MVEENLDEPSCYTCETRDDLYQIKRVKMFEIQCPLFRCTSIIPVLLIKTNLISQELTDVETLESLCQELERKKGELFILHPRVVPLRYLSYRQFIPVKNLVPPSTRSPPLPFVPPSPTPRPWDPPFFDSCLVVRGNPDLGHLDLGSNSP